MRSLHSQDHPLKPCAHCGRVIRYSKRYDMRKFCSQKCRTTYWRLHPELKNRRTYYSIACLQCGALFESYGNKHRKFCSRECFNTHRKQNSTQ